MKGKLIVFEGIDGAGGEEQSGRLLAYLKEKGMPAEKLTYPDYDNPVGNMIHEFLHKKYDFNEEVLFLLHAADRVKDKTRIKQFLDEGRMVICDRYYTSIFGYQCSHGISVENALKLAEMLDIPKPDVIIYLRISLETSIQRKTGEKGGDLDRNESNKEMQQRLAEQYEKLVRDQVWSSWYAIDGEKTKEEVFGQVRKILRV
jgi:dTMP kinase